MAASVNTGLTSVTGTVSSSITPFGTLSTETLVTYLGTCNNAEQNSYTVPAGKTLYVMGFSLYGSAKSAELRNNAGADKVAVLNSTSQTTTTIYVGIPLQIYTAGQVVKVRGTDAATIISWWGVEK